MSKEVRVRFAPSPTGFLHVGGARTALFNWLYARRHGGKFILRIEDTDIERSTKESENQLIDALTWLGLDWDEGPDIEGPHFPYRQSERMNIYREQANVLIEKGLAYEAYIYPEELEVMKENLLAEGKAPHYTYEMISKFDTPERREEYLGKGMLPVVYFKMENKEYELNDKIRGHVVFKEGAIGDWVIMRSNGLPTYNFACVIDDMMMQITHVIRGDDHLSNTLRQLAVYEAFEADIPQFAHVSMILGPDGKKLSKRHGATSVEEFRNKGYLPETVTNFLALLGWSHPEGKEIMPTDEIVGNFDLDRINPAPAIFDETKIKWMNGNYIRMMESERMYKLSVPMIINSGILTEQQCNDNKKWLVKALEVIQTSVEELQNVPEELKVFINNFDLDPNNEEFIGYYNANGVKDALRRTLELINSDDEWTEEIILQNIKTAMKESKPDKKAFYMGLRKIVTDQFHGPDLVKAIFLIGRLRVIERLEKGVAI